MLGHIEIERAARLIWNCWQTGETIERLPDSLSPSTRAEAYEIQAHYGTFSGSPIFGWKIAATSTAGQNHIGVSGPIVGRLLRNRVFQPDSSLRFGSNRMAVAEPEFAFRIGTTLYPRSTEYKLEEVSAAVASLHGAVEIPNSRFLNYACVGENNLIADNACAHEVVVGPSMCNSWRSLDLAHHEVSISVLNGETNKGIGANVLGDPWAALTWIANELSENNTSLSAGDTVITGTCADPISISSGDTVIVDYGTLGLIQVSFSEDG